MPVMDSTSCLVNGLPLWVKTSPPASRWNRTQVGSWSSAFWSSSYTKWAGSAYLSTVEPRMPASNPFRRVTVTHSRRVLDSSSNQFVMGSPLDFQQPERDRPGDDV